MHEPGEYIFLWDDAEFEAVYGHVEAEEFANTLRREGIPVERDWILEHSWGRFLFPEQPSDYDKELKLYEEKSKGTFPLTVGTCRPV